MFREDQEEKNGLLSGWLEKTEYIQYGGMGKRKYVLKGVIKI